MFARRAFEPVKIKSTYPLPYANTAQHFETPLPWNQESGCARRPMADDAGFGCARRGVGALFVAQINLLILFYMRRTSAPSLFISVSWLGAICFAGVTAWSLTARNPSANIEYVLGYTLGQLIFEVILVLFLTRYMQRSQRVRATFQEPCRQPQRLQGFRKVASN
ncbi:MAG: DUF2569 family protein [Gammaproteobacteria bacterium]